MTLVSTSVRVSQTSPPPVGRVAVDGKFFAAGGRRFPFRGVTYGTFGERDDGALYPSSDRVFRDLRAVRDAGFTVVRTYTEPPEDVVEAAAAWNLRLLAGVFYPDWRYLVGASKREQRRVHREAVTAVRAAARRLAGAEQVLALSLGNELPADVIRWIGTRSVARWISSLAEAAREEDGDVLVTYANYPTAEYLPLDDLDFLTFNVFLERRVDFRRYLTRLHHLAGDRPVVLGEVGLHAGDSPAGEARQAEVLDWQLEVATERGIAGTCVFSWTDEWAVGGQPVDGWRFGLTTADRVPRSALDVARRWNRSSVADLDVDWPSLSVVVCAYNAESTLDECLLHTCALDYPDLEIIVVDDGSTDRTAAIAAEHPRARLLSLPHGGLSVARNAGYEAASGKIVVYLDSDAYPTPEWPYHLALAFDGPRVGGAGGPNVAPRDDPPGAHRVARAPGGPVHVLVSDDRAEHVPGCNMAFLREVLEEAGGFDPVYTAAGDDVDLCWKVLDRGWEIGFHPAALVWHHRRAGTGAYLRQQRGYGKAEAFVEARHPSRFTPAGTARWRGRIYDSLVPSPGRGRVYRGLYGTAAYQSVYGAGGYGLDLAHQLGVPVALGGLVTAPLALVRPVLGLPAAVAAAFLVVLAALDVVRTRPPRHLRSAGLPFRLGVAFLHLAQPVVRTWGRARHGAPARRDVPAHERITGPVTVVSRHVLLLPADRARGAIVASIVADLRRAGLRVLPASAWDDHDGTLAVSTLVVADLVTSGHPEGYVQVRTRLRFRWTAAAVAAVLIAVTTAASPVAGLLVAAAAACDVVRGAVRSTVTMARVIRRAAEEDECSPS